MVASVGPYRGRPALFVNGRPAQPVLYSLTDSPGGRWSWEELPRRNLSLFAQQGFTLFQLDLWLEQMWTAPGALSIDLARRQIAGVLDAAPEAGVVLRLHVNAPRWWCLRHPDECVGYADGPVDKGAAWGLRRPLERDLGRALRQSLASAMWRHEAGEAVRQLCALLSATPEGDALAGMHVADGVFGEWSYYGFIEHEPDTGAAMTSFFRRWLGERYPDDEALRRAWKSPDVSRERALVPGGAERSRSLAGVFRDPARERRVMDYFACHHDAVADSILWFCHTVRDAWPRQLIVGVFYGYLFSMFGRQATGGHLRVDRVLASPDIDYLSSPQTYQPYSREIGGTGQSRGLLESCSLHGKLWLDEMDQPTHLGFVADRSFSSSREDAVALLRRNVLHPLLRGHGLWYYDFGPTFTSGWWDDPVLIAEIRRLKELFDRRLGVEYVSPADVLMVADTSVFLGTATGFRGDPISEPALDECAAAMYRSGVSFHMVHLADLERVDWQRYRAVVFANTWVLGAAERRFIREKIACQGRHLIWSYAPGYSDGERLSAELVSEVVGMKVEGVELGPGVRVPLEGAGCGSDVEALPAETRVSPLFAVTDERADVLARFEGTLHCALARRDGECCTVWFCSLPPRSPPLLRRMFRESGAHIWSDSGDVLIAGWGLVCLHTASGGERELLLPGGRRVTFRVPPRSTVLLDAHTGELLVDAPPLEPELVAG